MSSADRDILIRAVDRLLKAKEHDLEGEAVAIEQEIDRQVFSLYGLKEEDIRTVENAVHRKGGKSSSQAIEEVEA